MIVSHYNDHLTHSALPPCHLTTRRTLANSTTDVPLAIFPTLTPIPQPALTLFNQLDRKITMLNLTLHSLGDTLPTPLPATVISSALCGLLPTIAHLRTLDHGAALAFESVLKLAGNANSHVSGREPAADRQAYAAFYRALDAHLLDAVRRRRTTDPAWDVAADVARLEKTAAYLRAEIGLEDYFGEARQAMGREATWDDGDRDGGVHFSDDSR